MNVCPACFTGRLQRRQIPYLEWHGKKLLVVNRMPAIVCDTCGERVYDHNALEHLQQLIWSNPLRSSASSISNRTR